MVLFSVKTLSLRFLLFAPPYIHIFSFKTFDPGIQETAEITGSSFSV